MRNYFIALFLLGGLLCQSNSLFAQKYGHLNLGNLITMIPEVEGLANELETYQQKLKEDGEMKVKAFEKKVAALQARVDDLSPQNLKVEEQKLIEEQQKLMNLEQNLAMKLNQKRKELMSPVLQRVDVAIQTVGKENGYTLIFDTSVANALLFVQDSDDLTQLVLTKLGLAK